jgi:mRNA interferase HigB
MRLVGQELLTSFMTAHADARKPTEAWKAEVEAAEWRTQQDVTDRYATASFLRDRVAVFNIKGNRYRLAAQISFKRSIVRVLRVGTHAEYDMWTL